MSRCAISVLGAAQQQIRHCSDLLIVPYANPRGTAASAMAQPFPVPMMAGFMCLPPILADSQTLRRALQKELHAVQSP
jgi:hypothetical protein